MADDFDQFFRVFHEGAAVPIKCYQAAIDQGDGTLRGWFQPQAGYELQDGDSISIWTPVLRAGIVQDWLLSRHASRCVT